MIVFADVESTGLVATGDNPSLILELGLLICDDDLNVVAEQSWLPDTPYRLFMSDVDNFILEMHTNNGLWGDRNEPPGGALIPMAQMEREAVDFLHAHDAAGTPMYGSSLRLDRNLIDHWYPNLAAAFHYRSVDVSTLKEFTRKFFPNMSYPTSSELGGKAHRVLADCEASRVELAYYRDAFGGDI